MADCRNCTFLAVGFDNLYFALLRKTNNSCPKNSSLHNFTQTLMRWNVNSVTNKVQKLSPIVAEHQNVVSACYEFGAGGKTVRAVWWCPSCPNSQPQSNRDRLMSPVFSQLMKKKINTFVLKNTNTCIDQGCKVLFFPPAEHHGQ